MIYYILTLDITHVLENVNWLKGVLYIFFLLMIKKKKTAIKAKPNSISARSQIQYF